MEDDWIQCEVALYNQDPVHQNLKKKRNNNECQSYRDEKHCDYLLILTLVLDTPGAIAEYQESGTGRCSRHPGQRGRCRGARRGTCLTK
jgi:hypothetical protein